MGYDSYCDDRLGVTWRPRGIEFQALGRGERSGSAGVAVRFMPSCHVWGRGLPDQSGLSVAGRLERDVRTQDITGGISFPAGDYSGAPPALGGQSAMHLKPFKRDQPELACSALGVAENVPDLRAFLIVRGTTRVSASRVSTLISSHDVEKVGAGHGKGRVPWRVLRSRTYYCMRVGPVVSRRLRFALLQTIARTVLTPSRECCVYTGARTGGASKSSRAAALIPSPRHQSSGAKSPRSNLLDDRSVTLFSIRAIFRGCRNESRDDRKARTPRCAGLKGGQHFLIVRRRT